MSFLWENASWIALVVSIAGLVFALYTRSWILRQDAGNEKMAKIAGAIQRGARAFLMTEYRFIAVVVVLVVIVLLVLSAVPGSGMSPWTAVCFVAGAAASTLAGYIGMNVAVRANVRTT